MSFYYCGSDMTQVIHSLGRSVLNPLYQRMLRPPTHMLLLEGVYCGCYVVRQKPLRIGGVLHVTSCILADLATMHSHFSIFSKLAALMKTLDATTNMYDVLIGLSYTFCTAGNPYLWTSLLVSNTNTETAMLSTHIHPFKRAPKMSQVLEESHITRSKERVETGRRG